jgi:6-phosphofructokinase
VGIRAGYRGLIDGDYQVMQESQFSGLLTMGGTILGTSRTPFRNMRVVDEDNVDKVQAMKMNYGAMKLDCLVTLGGNGTHKTANLLRNEGLNVIGLPKTIDNDIFGTDFTFGFHTAVGIATDVIDRIHTTAASHDRCMIIEIMGNKVGWLTLYAGMAGGADVILLPEIPYNIEKVAEVIAERAKLNKHFTIIAMAEGAMSVEEAGMKRKDRLSVRAKCGHQSVSMQAADQLQQISGVECRTVIPGHMQRGGSPCAYDRVLSTQFGVHAAKLIKEGRFGLTVALKGNVITENRLEDVAGIPKPVDPGDQIIGAARNINISFGN